MAVLSSFQYAKRVCPLELPFFSQINFCGAKSPVKISEIIFIVEKYFSFTSIFVPASQKMWWCTSACLLRVSHSVAHALQSWLFSQNVVNSEGSNHSCRMWQWYWTTWTHSGRETYSAWLIEEAIQKCLNKRQITKNSKKKYSKDLCRLLSSNVLSAVTIIIQIKSWTVTCHSQRYDACSHKSLGCGPK